MYVDAPGYLALAHGIESMGVSVEDGMEWDSTKLKPRGSQTESSENADN